MPENTKQTPIQETAEHLAEASPAMIFPRMVETIHLNQQRKAYRRRVEDSHRQQAAILAGKPMPDPIPAEAEDDDVGDSFSIAGDTHITVSGPSQAEKFMDSIQGLKTNGGTEAPRPAPQSSVPEPEPAWKTWAKRAALAGIPALGAAGGTYWATRPEEQPPPAIERPVDYEIIGPGVRTERMEGLPETGGTP